MTTRQHARSRSRAAEPSATKYLTMAQVCERYGNCSPITIERRLQNDPDFPKPMHFGKRMRLFAENKLEAYERLRVVMKEEETKA
jgi:hypothetical protein